MSGIIDRLHSHLERSGAKGQVVSVRRLQELRHEVEDRQAGGLFDKTFYGERLASCTFTPPDDFASAESLIIIASPSPQTRVSFTWNGRTIPLILPPTYVNHREVSEQQILTDFLAPEGYHAAAARLPLKALAVRSGLTAYGRNNVCYVPGMGSFVQLAAFYSDLPCQEDSWREAVMMDMCRDCRACQLKCPTGAISSDRFLLHAERCIVFHNERPGKYAFPAWLDLTSHDCLLGCMYCQRYCPVDKPFLDWFGWSVEFSEEETSLLLQGVPPDQLPAPTMEKLKRLELLDYLEMLPRNLRASFATR